MKYKHIYDFKVNKNKVCVKYKSILNNFNICK